MRHVVLDMKIDCFVRDTVNPDSVTQVLRHARKMTCAGVRRGFGVVLTG